MAKRSLIGFFLVIFVATAFPVSAVANGVSFTATPDPEFQEAGFKLHGTHGFSISVFAYSPGPGKPGTIGIDVRGLRESVSYKAPATVTADGLDAEVGDIAKVNLIRHGLGHQRTVHMRCTHISQTYEEAVYEGTFEFNGEKGYTRARQTRVAEVPAWLLPPRNGFCSGGYGEAIGTGEPGAKT